jgi:hypothetical protein
MLKGAAIAMRLYEQPSARLAGDLDLLVEPGRAHSLVRQRWYSARGWPRDLMIGVEKRDHDLVMYAWLEGDPEERHDALTQLFRHGAPPVDS